MFINVTEEQFLSIENNLYDEALPAVLLFSSDQNNKSDEIINRLMTLSNDIMVPIYNVNINEADSLAEKYYVGSEDVPCILLFADGDVIDRFDERSSINMIIDRIMDI